MHQTFRGHFETAIELQLLLRLCSFVFYFGLFFTLQIYFNIPLFEIKKILFLQQLISLCLIGLPELYAKNIAGVLNIDNAVEMQK
jgi:hypothetical protein